jgi:hypothetical protein
MYNKGKNSQNFWIWRTPPNFSVDQGWHRKHDGAKWGASLYSIELASIVTWFVDSAHVALKNICKSKPAYH